MLIWLDASVLTADLSSDVEACHGISAVFDAVFRGEHYAMGSRATLNSLARNPHLSSGTRSVISTVHSNFSMIGGLSDIVTTRLVITHDQNVEPTKTADTVWEVPLRYVGVYGVSKTVLLGENLDDVRAYELAANHYKVSATIGGRVCLEQSHGGGSTTPDVLSNLVEHEKRWCLCITDSDRICPTDEMDVTALRCRAIAVQGHSIASHHDLGVREIENVVPLAFLAKAIPPTHTYKWDWHVERLLALCPDAHRYCDMKLGTTRRKIYSLPAGSSRRTYWELVLRTLSAAAALRHDCEGNCETLPDEQCDCLVTYGFGENLLSTVLRCLETESVHASEKRTRNDPLRQQWIDIGKHVFEWACAPSPMRS